MENKKEIKKQWHMKKRKDY